MQIPADLSANPVPVLAQWTITPNRSMRGISSSRPTYRWRRVIASARVLGPKGRELSDNDIGSVLATRDLMTELRQGGVVTGGPAPMGPKDRSRFLAKLDELVNAVKRANPAKK